MRKIGLIALDLDGTLLDPQGRVPQSAREAVAQAREAGVEVVISTGRSAQEAAFFAQEAGCGILAAALGGSVYVPVVAAARLEAHIRQEHRALARRGQRIEVRVADEILCVGAVRLA